MRVNYICNVQATDDSLQVHRSFSGEFVRRKKNNLCSEWFFNQFVFETESCKNCNTEVFNASTTTYLDVNGE